LEKFGIEHVGIGQDPMIGSLNEYVTGHYRPDLDVGAVIVSMDKDFSLPKLLKAMNYLLKPDVMLLATNADDRSEFPGFVFPDTGRMRSWVHFSDLSIGWGTRYSRSVMVNLFGAVTENMHSIRFTTLLNVFGGILACRGTQVDHYCPRSS
jgi:hypothetical protein